MSAQLKRTHGRMYQRRLEVSPNTALVLVANTVMAHTLLPVVEVRARSLQSSQMRSLTALLEPRLLCSNNRRIICRTNRLTVGAVAIAVVVAVQDVAAVLEIALDVVHLMEARRREKHDSQRLLLLCCLLNHRLLPLQSLQNKLITTSVRRSLTSSLCAMVWTVIL